MFQVRIARQKRRVERVVSQTKKYVQDLSFKDKILLRSYTHVGDVLVNNYSRGTLKSTGLRAMFEHDTKAVQFLAYYLFDQYTDFSGKIRMPPRDALLTDLTVRTIVNPQIFKQIVLQNLDFLSEPSHIAPLVEAYRQDLIRIISAAPHLLEPLVVYRGFRSESHLKGLNYINPDFVSTSLDLHSALSFSLIKPTNGIASIMSKSGPQYFGGVYEITIPVSVPCIYVECCTDNMCEYEIVLPPGLQFTFDSRFYCKIIPSINFDANLLANTGKENKVGIVHATVDLVGGVGGGKSTKPTKRQTRRRVRTLKT